MLKHILREDLLLKLKKFNCSSLKLRKLEKKIHFFLKSQDLRNSYKKIGIFYPIQFEPELHKFWQGLSLEFELYAPLDIDKFAYCNNMNDFRYDKTLKFWLPTSDRYLTVNDLDILFMPMLGFDLMGNRLGRGGGFFDKSLVSVANLFSPIRVGIAWSVQKYSMLPTNDWDINLHYVITERSIYDCR